MRKVFSALFGVAVVLAFALPARADVTAGWTMEDLTGYDAVSGITVAPDASISLTTGASGNGWLFTGAGRASTGSAGASALDPSSDDFTVTVDVNTTSVPNDAVGDYDVVRKGLSSDTGGYYKVELIPNLANTKSFALCQMRGQKGTKLVLRKHNVSTGTWHTITCTRTTSAAGQTETLTLDGAYSVTKTVAVGSIANTAPFSIGGKAQVDEDLYVGSVDDVGVTIATPVS